MKNKASKNTPVTEKDNDPISAIAMENFEIEDIRDLDLNTPMSVEFCSTSSCSSTSSGSSSCS